MPPNALIGSAFIALFNAEDNVSPCATPQGFVCLSIANVGASKLYSAINCAAAVRSRILLYPSLFDANPNTVREAYNVQCLPLLTRNIGYAELYPEYLICNSFDKEEWSNKILYLLHKSRTDFQ